MIETLIHSISYTPAIIFMATILDIFFITGYIFYGFAMLSVVGTLLMTGLITTEALIIAGSLGTITGNLTNFYIGKKFGSTQYIQKKLNNKRIQKISHQMQSHTLFVVMIICRFITVLRPAYALLLGTLGVNTKRFVFYEIIISITWITFWILIIIGAGEIIMNIF